MDLTIYDARQYFKQLLGLVTATKSGDQVVLASMSFDPRDPTVSRLINELVAASERGAKVELMIDAYSFALDARHLPTGPVMFGNPINTCKQSYFREKYLALEKLKTSGGKYYIVNMPSRKLASPYAGRSHIKCAIINDTVFVGGCNLSRTWQFDYMARFTDKKAANWLQKTVTEAGNTGSVRKSLNDKDLQFKIDDTTTLLIDAGKPKQSLIYKTALDFIDNASEQLVMTCQFFPNTITANHLSMTHKRGTNIKLYYNHPYHHAPHERWVHYAVVWGEKMRRPKVLFEHEIGKNERRLHAKLLASGDSILVGSHNYVTHGVNFGTAEIALLTTSAQARKQALDILHKNLNR